MARPPFKLAALVADLDLPPETPSFPSSARTGVAALASTDTLRFTLSHTRSESFWHFMHSAGTSEFRELALEQPQFRTSLRPLQHAATASTLQCRPRSRSAVNPFLTHLGKAMPTDHDYRRMHNRLEKLIHGSALSFRSMTLSEAKPAELTLDYGEWQYLKIKTQGMQVPMKIAMRRVKGKVVCYLSKSAQEPNDLFYDEMHTKDDFQYSEAGLRFRSAWVFLGLKCTEEAALTVTVRFGIRRQKHKPLTRMPTLADLAELRKDDEKRKALYINVEAILTQRQEEWRRKYHTKDFIRANKGLQLVDFEARKESERAKMEETRKRAHELFKARKERAEDNLKKQERRKEENALRKARAEERKKVEVGQKALVAVSCLLSLSSNLHARFLSRKADIHQGFRMLAAAKMIQRCYRRMHFYIHPKNMARQLIQHHLRLLLCHFGPIRLAEVRERIFTIIRGSAKPKELKRKMEIVYMRGKVYSVITIQHCWRQYRTVMKQRMDDLLALWAEALNVIHANAPHATVKKGQKKAKETETKYQQIDARKVLELHFKSCARQFLEDIKAWREQVKGIQRNTVFATQYEDRPSFPPFRWQLSLDEVQQLIHSSAPS